MRENDFLDIRIPRSIVTAAGVFTIATGGKFLADIVASGQTPQKRENQPQDELVDQIREFEANVGDSKLSLEQLRTAYLPLLAQFYVRETGTPLTPEQILSKTFLISTDPYSTSSSPEKSVQKLLEEYPNLHISENKNHNIQIGLATRDRLGWMDEEDKEIYLVLPRLNQVGNSHDPYDIYLQSQTLVQFNGTGPILECQSQTPISHIRSTFLHELAHLDSDYSRLSLNKGAAIAYDEISNRKSSFPPIHFSEALSKGGFRVELPYQDINGSTYEIGLDELVADYISMKISSKYNLPYTFRYVAKHNPHEMTNFERILEQSRISLEALVFLHRESDIEGFLSRISQSAENKIFENDQDTLTFGVQNFLFQSAAPLDRGKLKTHYPAIEETPYIYLQKPYILNQYNIGSVAKQGCLN